METWIRNVLLSKKKAKLGIKQFKWLLCQLSSICTQFSRKKIFCCFFRLILALGASTPRQERRRSKAYVSRGKRQNSFNPNWSYSQQQKYISPPSAASFAPEYHQTTVRTNLSRAGDSYVQGERRTAANPASIALNAGNAAQYPQHNAKKVSPLKNEERVAVKDKFEGKPQERRGRRKGRGRLDTLLHTNLGYPDFSIISALP